MKYFSSLSNAVRNKIALLWNSGNIINVETFEKNGRARDEEKEIILCRVIIIKIGKTYMFRDIF